jgi:hypothetical protein
LASSDFEKNVWEIGTEIIELVLEILAFLGKKAYLVIFPVWQGKMCDFKR